MCAEKEKSFREFFNVFLSKILQALKDGEVELRPVEKITFNDLENFRIDDSNFNFYTAEELKKKNWNFDDVVQNTKWVNTNKRSYNVLLNKKRSRYLPFIGGIKSLRVNTDKIIDKLTTLKHILPKKYREEFAGDLIEMYKIMKNEGRHPFHIFVIIFLNIVNITWGAIMFKYDQFFDQEEKTKVADEN